MKNRMFSEKELQRRLDHRKHIYTLGEADNISTELQVRLLPAVIYYQDEETRKVITYKLRQVGIGYVVNDGDRCIRKVFVTSQEQ